LATVNGAGAGRVAVKVFRNGPLRITGAVSLSVADGTTYETTGAVLFCRCGGSSDMPFCDGTHSRVGSFDDEPLSLPDATRRPAYGRTSGI
jgi:CDGSH-type Zn-finger protein